MAMYNMKFCCRFGGEPGTVRESRAVEYGLIGDGADYIVIVCGDTGWKDAEGRQIYEVESGDLFVWVYTLPQFEGDKDSGFICPPTKFA
jgi:hypothetical protein